MAITTSPHSSETKASQNLDSVLKTLPAFVDTLIEQKSSYPPFVVRKASSAWGRYCFQAILSHPSCITQKDN